MGARLKIILLGRFFDCTTKDAEQLLKRYGINDATVKIQGEATIDDIEDAIFEDTVYKPAIIIANKADTPNATKKPNNSRPLAEKK